MKKSPATFENDSHGFDVEPTPQAARKLAALTVPAAMPAPKIPEAEPVPVSVAESELPAPKTVVEAARKIQELTRQLDAMPNGSRAEARARIAVEQKLDHVKRFWHAAQQGPAPLLQSEINLQTSGVGPSDESVESVRQLIASRIR